MTAHGFDAMSANAVHAVEQKGEATLEGIIAMGQAHAYPHRSGDIQEIPGKTTM